jgi:hypothetical protein
MFRFLSKLARKFQTANTMRTPRRADRRAMLGLEGLEDRLVMNGATLTGSTLVVNVDPGVIQISSNHPIDRPGGGDTIVFELAEFQVDKAHPGMLDVTFSDSQTGISTAVQLFPIAKIKTVEVKLANLDGVIVDDSNGLPFAAGTHVLLSGTGGNLNSLSLMGSRGINGGETYTAVNGAHDGSLTVGGTNYEFSGAIGSVKDTLQTTLPLVVKTFGQHVSLTGSDGVTQTLTDLYNGVPGADGFIFSNKIGVDLELLGTNANASLNATAAADDEHSFVVHLFGKDESLSINATPSSGSTSVVAIGKGCGVFVAANSDPVFVHGNATTDVILGTNQGIAGVTSGIMANVSVKNVGTLVIADEGNNTTQENVQVTESTISGTGLFGNDAVVVHYNTIGKLDIYSGQKFENYAIAGSTQTAGFRNQIMIDDSAEGGLFVTVGVDPRSNLDLVLDNASTGRLSADLIFTALGATFNPSSPPVSDNFAPTLSGSEIATFPDGGHSIVHFSDFSEVVAINHLIPVNPVGGGSAETVC